MPSFDIRGSLPPFSPVFHGVVLKHLKYSSFFLHECPSCVSVLFYLTMLSQLYILYTLVNCERKWQPIWRFCPGICLKGVRETTSCLRQYSRSAFLRVEPRIPLQSQVLHRIVLCKCDVALRELYLPGADSSRTIVMPSCCSSPATRMNALVLVTLVSGHGHHPSETRSRRPWFESSFRIYRLRRS
jgi:hypothetical protein